jgi:hypothetical protein
VSTDRWRASSSGSRASCCLALASGLLLGIGAADASAHLVGPMSWQAPVLVDAQGVAQAPEQLGRYNGPPAASYGLGPIACPSVSLCVAADSSGNVITSNGPVGGGQAWKVAHVDNNTVSCETGECPASLPVISCPSVSFCIAMDTAGSVLTTTDPTAGAAAWISTKLDTPYAVESLSCPSVSLCVAGDDGGDILVSPDPENGARTWSIAKIDSAPCPAYFCHVARALISIACPAVSMCVTGDWAGHLFYSTDPTGGGSAWSLGYVDSGTVAGNLAVSPTTGIPSIVCPSSNLCLATDEVGNLLVSEDPASTNPTWRQTVASPHPSGAILGSRGQFSLACPSGAFCAALDALAPSEADLSYQPLAGQSWTPVPIDPGGKLNALVCPSVVLCLASDQAGRIVVGRSTLLTPAQVRASLKAEIAPREPLARIGVLRRRTTVLLPLTAPTDGKVVVRWLLASTRSIAHPHRTRVLRAVIARGEGNFPIGGRGVIELKLNSQALALFAKRKHSLLIAQAKLSTQEGKQITATSYTRFRR